VGEKLEIISKVYLSLFWSSLTNIDPFGLMNDSCPINNVITSLYRAVSPEEFNDVMNLDPNAFRTVPGSLDAKQFGFDLDEVLRFADWDLGAAAILEVRIPTNILNSIGDFTPVDRFIFRSGTVTIHGRDLARFNESILSIIHAY